MYNYNAKCSEFRIHEAQCGRSEKRTPQRSAAKPGKASEMRWDVSCTWEVNKILLMQRETCMPQPGTTRLAVQWCSSCLGSKRDI